jgi:hypothetical protein
VIDLQHRQHQQVRQLPKTTPIPAWLQSLLTAQKGAKLLLIGVFVLIPIVYGYTVHTQTLWKQQHGKLKRIQVKEWQQGVMNENLKHGMAEIAEQPQSGLVAPTPDRMVFMPSAPQRQPKSLPQPSASKPKSLPQRPVGY